VLVQAFGLEPFQVPTGSMAPTLEGHHHVCTCPRCRMSVDIGRASADYDGQGGTRYYTRSCCPNCGESPLPVADVPETAGDHVLVNKAAFAVRAPRRWEVVVFRLFGIVFIKRLVGLPGETVAIKDGDVYIDSNLARKSFAQAWAMRVPIFDATCQPPSGWAERWEREPNSGTDDGGSLLLDGRAGHQTYTFHTSPGPDGKCPPLWDEYAYNAGLHGGSEAVHDFLVEADVELRAGSGSLALRLCDGESWVEVAIPANRTHAITTRSWPMDKPTLATDAAVQRTPFALRHGRTHHLAMSFVDRRFSLCVDGLMVVEDVDLPVPRERKPVIRPVQIEATGMAVAVRNFRLFRDVHYTARGRQGVGGQAVRLGAEQYFVLGDNSPNSQDSRFWPIDGISASQLLGPAFLVHLPSQPFAWHCAGCSGQCQLPAPGRIRWIR
jgi:signal peptidase I